MHPVSCHGQLSDNFVTHTKAAGFHEPTVFFSKSQQRSSRLTASSISTRSSIVKSVKVDPFGFSDMIKFLLTFGAGIYTGIYITQNYEVPRVDEPAKLWEKTSEKVKDILDQHKKP